MYLSDLTTKHAPADVGGALICPAPPALFAQGVTGSLPPASTSPVIGQVALSARRHELQPGRSHPTPPTSGLTRPE